MYINLDITPTSRNLSQSTMIAIAVYGQFRIKIELRIQRQCPRERTRAQTGREEAKEKHA
jgi:hypothetical protein